MSEFLPKKSPMRSEQPSATWSATMSASAPKECWRSDASWLSKPR